MADEKKDQHSGLRQAAAAVVLSWLQLPEITKDLSRFTNQSTINLSK